MTEASGRYWIQLDFNRVVIRRQRMNHPPMQAVSAEAIWFACGKKLWSKVRPGDAMAVEDLPAKVVEQLVAARRKATSP